LVIITADHGEEFGEHGLFTHGNSLYLPAIHVPLLVLHPSVPRGRRIREPVELRGLPATIAELMPGTAADFPGHSWRAPWNDPNASNDRAAAVSDLGQGIEVPSWYRVGKGPVESVVRDRWHYIRWGDGREELFDIVSDPWETRDVARTIDDQEVLKLVRDAAP